MISSQGLAQQSLEMSQEAAKQDKHPLPVWPEDVSSLTSWREYCRGVPFLAEYVAPGWAQRNVQNLQPDNLYDTYFVDSSGLGESGEAALTPEQFRQQVKALCDMHGYRFGLGIAEAGQFQVNIYLYEQVP